MRTFPLVSIWAACGFSPIARPADGRGGARPPGDPVSLDAGGGRDAGDAGGDAPGIGPPPFRPCRPGEPPACEVREDGVSLSRDVQPIFDRECALDGCHTGPTAIADLRLEPDRAHAALVCVPAARAGRNRVEPCLVTRSYLVHLLEGSQADLVPDALGRMPLGSDPLRPDDAATVIDWILAGAPDN